MREIIRWSGIAVLAIITGIYFVNRALSERGLGRGSLILAIIVALLALAWFWFFWPGLWSVISFWQ